MATRHLKPVAVLLAAILFGVALWLGWLRMSIVEEDVGFTSGELSLRGTLLAQRFALKSPAIVLVHGSGEVSRKSMLGYAWLFAIKGYAVLAYDKRGVGASEGTAHEWQEFDFDDLAADAAAGFKLLQSHPSVDPKRVGFFGASQGAWVVSLAADQVENPAFLIMASASFSTVAEDRIHGRAAQVRHLGYEDADVDAAVALIQADHEVTRSGVDGERLIQLWNASSSSGWFEEIYSTSLPLPAADPYRAWERSVLDFDPRPLLEKLNVPVLWIFGDPAFDRFSPVALSLDRVEEAKRQGAPYTVIQVDNVGHTLELVEGGSIQSLIRVRIPLVLDIYDWLDALNATDHR